MTISFRCPWCKNICAFADLHSGKRAKCTACQQLFIIPDAEGAKAAKVKVKDDVGDGDVFSGFYSAVFKKSKQLFTSKANITGLVFIGALVLLKFIVWNFGFQLSFYVQAIGDTVTIPLPIGMFVGLAVWGLIVKFYMGIVYTTAFGGEAMPDIEVGVGFDFLFNAARPLYLCLASMTVAQIPTLMAMGIMHLTGSTSVTTLYAMAAGGCFVFPMLLLMSALSQDLTSVLRLDLAIGAIGKVFIQYLLAGGFVLIVLAGIFLSKQYSLKMAEKGLYLLPVYLLANMLTAAAGLFAARTLGLLYRHYGGLMPW